MVFYAPYAMGWMERVWGDDVQVFRPERWLDEHSVFQPESPFKFTAFEASPRICVGKEFTYRQMKIFALGFLLSVAANRIKPPSFVQYGLGLPGCSFFAFDGEPPQMDTARALSTAAIIFVQGQKISPRVLLEGLRVWAADGWEWQIQQISDFKFSVVFPSSESLSMIASCTSFTLLLNQLVISIKAARNGSKDGGQLSEVWVLVEDVPAELRSVPFLMAFGILLGKPIEVDGESLARLTPVHLKLWCVDSVCLHGSIDVFPSSVGIRLRIRLEGAEGVQAPPPPPPPAPSHSDKCDDGMDDGGMNPSGGSGGAIDAHFTHSEWDRLGPEVQDVMKQNVPKDDAQQVVAVYAATTIEKSAPVGTPISGVCSNMPIRPVSPCKSGIEDLPGSPAGEVLAPEWTNLHSPIHNKEQFDLGVESEGGSTDNDRNVKRDRAAATDSAKKAAKQPKPDAPKLHKALPQMRIAVPIASTAATSVSTPLKAGEDHMDLDVMDNPDPRPGIISINFTLFYGLDLSTDLVITVAALDVESEKNQLQLEYDAMKKVLEEKDQVLVKVKEKSEFDEKKLADFDKLVEENAKMKKEILQWGKKL
ncbi:hypothetical protein D1007_46750 [Hordeum vulgare]|nr:hypothetical protein D1007_46750 [Hordeum vulgare]